MNTRKSSSSYGSQFGRQLWLIQRALAPLAIGLILATGYTLARGADRSPGALALTVLATAVLAFTRVNPVWVLVAAAVLGAAGLA